MNQVTFTFDATKLFEIQNRLLFKVFLGPSSIANGQAIVRITTSSLNNLEYINIYEERGCLRLEILHDSYMHLIGQILVEIEIDCTALAFHTLVNRGSGALYVENLPFDRLLSPNLTLENHGSGKLWLRGPHIAIQNLVCRSNGSGNVRVEANSGVLGTLDIHNNGSGSTKIIVDAMTVQALSTHIAGSGSVHVASVKSMNIQLLSSHISGSGSITYSGTGTAKMHEAQCNGSGSIRSDAIISHDANVSLSGSGSILTQVANELTSRLSGSGSSKYINPPPRTIHGKAHLVLGTMPPMPQSHIPFPEHEPEDISSIMTHCIIM
ncbi:hypothetical protein THRCLA_22702 [Thraustotheca clavata]|uniref:Putative auto-transporter adhesin head GIN domain-containing protein n=1 Tax=Thraustotheca clavata TaxID=74557 RepID=A0A1V9YUM7_9STRA|nr:hypothetical protein THRCLA_22702 [Thraustotheca clavata]